MAFLVGAIAFLMAGLMGYHLFLHGQSHLLVSFMFFASMGVLAIFIGFIEREMHKQSRIEHLFKDIR